ncbi:protocadherin-12 [Protopterus annectens]|uniref:protocadherin-12 n=1 Tax=Protopterus annectens TaxID=7888 RepID=UPI001CFAA040|nr:protocadherin-12 [Protopterus annectens]XP_043925475.1 protocadherin-12 [Protopterus annectens]
MSVYLKTTLKSMACISLTRLQFILLLWYFLCQTVTIAGATFTNIKMKYQVFEEVAEGTPIGKLLDDVRLEGEVQKRHFRMMQPVSAVPIQVRTEDGQISSVGRLDRETLCRKVEPCILSFTVMAESSDAMDLIQVEIQVLDVNDHEPQFPNLGLEIEISESASLGTKIPLDQASDSDIGSNALQMYNLSTTQHFNLNTIRRADGSIITELVVIKELDREMQSSFDLLLIALDGGSPPKSGTCQIKIHLLDSNDNSPVFEKNYLTIEIWENSLPGTTLIKLNATDPDQGLNGEIEYSFGKHVSQEILSTFSIDPKTGQITLIGSLDYEERQSYEIDIQARDLGPNPIPAHVKLHIKVWDKNDNRPKIYITWASQKSDTVSVSEAVPKDGFVALVTATDSDSGSNGQVNCFLRHGHGHFRLKKTYDNYVLVVNSTLDREKLSEYNITVVAKDQGSPQLISEKHLTIQIVDENDNPPVFEKNHYLVTVFENYLYHSPLLIVKAHDADEGMNAKVTYSVQHSIVSETLVTSLVRIDPVTGDIYVVRELDYEQIKSFNIIVKAQDGGSPMMMSETLVTIDIIDKNDNYPVITHPVLKNNIALINIPIDKSTGQMVIAVEEFNSHLQPKHLARHMSGTLAMAHNLESRSSSSSQFAISKIQEGKSVPKVYPVITVRAEDADSPPNANISYHILNVDDAHLFSLNEKTGQLYLNSSNCSGLIGSQWDLELLVLDGGRPPLSTKAFLTFTFSNHQDQLKNSTNEPSKVSLPIIMLIIGGVVLGLFLLIIALMMSVCRTEKKDNRAYNCREAESAYKHHPRRPQRQIQKTDILLIPPGRSRGEKQRDNLKCQPQQSSTMDSAAGSPTGSKDDLIQASFNMSPTLYRTLRNQRNHEFPDENKELSQAQFILSPTLSRTLQRNRGLTKDSYETFQCNSQPHTKILKNPGTPEIKSKDEQADSSSSIEPTPSPPVYATMRRQKIPEQRSGDIKDPRKEILRSLFRLSMAALAERESVELTTESPHIQQVSQLLSLLHQGRFQPRPNFRGNKYSTKTIRSNSHDADCLSTKDSGHGESEAGDIDSDIGGDAHLGALLEEGFENLLNPDTALDQKTLTDVPDPSWMARLSLPLTTNYRDNIFIPDSLDSTKESPDVQTDAAKSFSTFGKNTGMEENSEGPNMANNFLSEMSSLFELLLTQKAEAHAVTSSDVLLRLSACGKSLGLDVDPSGICQEFKSPAETFSQRKHNC